MILFLKKIYPIYSYHLSKLIWSHCNSHLLLCMVPLKGQGVAQLEEKTIFSGDSEYKVLDIICRGKIRLKLILLFPFLKGEAKLYKVRHRVGTNILREHHDNKISLTETQLGLEQDGYNM